jgi:hypothetical protein
MGVALTLISLVAIAALTLSPGPAPNQPVSFGIGCLVCGPTGGADVLANVALFAPLGAALVLAGMPWWGAALAGAGLSGAIELTQYLAITGRFATVSDLLTNTTGTTLAAALTAFRGIWLRPRARGAALLTAVGALGFAAALAFGAWALGGLQDTVVMPSRVDPQPVPTGMGWFGGRVIRASLGDYSVEHRGRGPVTISATARRGVHAEVLVVDEELRRSDLRPLLYVHRPWDINPWLVLGTEGRDLVLEPALRGRRLRLRLPTVSVRRVPVGTRQEPGPYRFSAAVTGDRLTVAFEQGLVRRVDTIRLSPTLGWALLSPFPRANSPLAPLASAAWVAGLAVPLGYWARWLARGGRRAGGAALVVVAGGLTAGLVAVPLAFGFAVARPWEWIAAVAGAAAGAAAAEVVRRIR